MSDLVSEVNRRFEERKTARTERENIWNECWYNMLGVYTPMVIEKWDAQKYQGSRLFIRATGQKIRAARAKMSSMFEGVERCELAAMKGKEVNADALEDMAELLSSYAEMDEFKAKLGEIVHNAAWSGVGVLRCPQINTRKTFKYTKNELTSLRDTQVEEKSYPGSMVLDPRQYYPSPHIAHPDEGDGFTLLHILPMATFADTAKSLGWDNAVVQKVLKNEIKGESEQSWESAKRAGEKQSAAAGQGKQVRVLETWGPFKVKDLQSAGVKDVKGEPGDYVEAVVVTCGGEILKASLNPYFGVHRCLLVFKWFPIPQSPWGEGIAEQCLDKQAAINKAVRSYFNGIGLASAPMMEYDASKALPGQNPAEIYEGKIWERVDGADGPIWTPVVVPGNAEGYMQIIDIFLTMMGEDTGITQFSQGSSAPAGVKTATGQSITQANTNNEAMDRARAVDEFVEDMFERYYQWEMANGEDEGIKVDAVVKARGIIKSSMAKEIQSQRMSMVIAQLPELLTLPKEGAPNSAMEGIDVSEIVRTYFKSVDVHAEAEDGDKRDTKDFAELGKQLYAMLGPDGVAALIEGVGGGMGQGAGVVPPVTQGAPDLMGSGPVGGEDEVGELQI